MYTYSKKEKFPLKKAMFMVLGIFFLVLSYGIGSAFLEQDGIAKVLGAKANHIMVEGALYVDQQDLREKIGLNYGDPLIGFDASAVRSRVEELPWVSKAEVQRQLPSTVKIKLYEKKPLALWQAENGRYVLDREGEPINKATEMFNYLPLLTGENSSKSAQALFAMIAESPHLNHKITSAEFIGKRRWNLMFENNVLVQLPENVPVSAMKKLKKLNDSKQVMQVGGLVIDLRVEDRIILRLPENVDLSEGWPPQGKKNSV
jgi:cell division protein FtsQ